MKTFSLEWNAVTTLETPDRSGYDALQTLVALHGTSIDLGIATTAASENTKKQKLPETANEFTKRLEAVGLGGLTMVLTSSVIGLSYIGLSCIPDDAYGKTVQELWKIIKPTHLPQSHKDFAIENDIADSIPISEPEYQKWRNKWCDVHSLEAHIRAGRDVFVTGDLKNFRGKAREKLASLGVGHICSYDEALEIALQETAI